MKRELKFRAYHKIQKRMFEVYGLGLDFITENTLDGVSPGDNCWQGDELKNIEIMQFTGLTDKNGVDIYENDIVRTLYTDWGSKNEDDPRSLDQYLKDIASIGVVEFNNSSWEVFFKSDKHEYYDGHRSIYPGNHGYIEVIGNIHEHKHLLK